MYIKDLNYKTKYCAIKNIVAYSDLNVQFRIISYRIYISNINRMYSVIELFLVWEFVLSSS